MTRLIISGDYTVDWPEISRATRDEAGWRCVRCRHPFESGTGRPLPCDASCDQARGRRAELTHQHDFMTPGLNYGVHHLDGDKSNNAWWNRLALCNSCHLYVQASVIPDRLFMFSHSSWFLPYVCGFFAWQIGVDITREEAEAEPGKWIAIGQPWLYPETAP